MSNDENTKSLTVIRRVVGSSPTSGAIELSEIARRIFADALTLCNIDQGFRSKFERAIDGRPHAFMLRGASDEPVANIDLAGVDRVLIIAAGKSAATMLQGLLERLPSPSSCTVSGVLIAPSRPQQLSTRIEFFLGAHPLPDSQSFRGAEAALALIREAASRKNPEKTFCFFLISGGASAMMELPLDPSISLEDTIAFHRALVHSGASIAEVNCIRKHFSAVKGGRLGQLAAGIPNLTILVSDVPAGRLDSLASGPTLPDSSTVQQCLEIIDRYNLIPKFPSRVRAFFETPGIPETPKPQSFSARVVTLLSDANLAEAARCKAESLGFTVIVDNSCDDWDYRPAAAYLLAKLRDLRKVSQRACLISVGEVSVEVSRSNGLGGTAVGGRNQHFALYASTLLEAADLGKVALLSAGSDGIDGNSQSAGAVLDFELLRTGEALASNIADPSDEQFTRPAIEALSQFDSGTFLNRIGATIETGPTGNNLRDLRLFLAI